MGNHKFRLSDMMPNAWFYKLKDMSRKTRKHNSSHPSERKPPPSTTTTESHEPQFSHPRCSYYSTESTIADKFSISSKHSKASETHFPDPPRRSSKRRTNRKTIYKPSPRLVTSSVSAGCSCPATLDSIWTEHSPFQSPTYSVSPNDSPTISTIHESLLLSDSESEEWAAPDSFELRSCSSSCNCGVCSSSTDIIIDMNNESFTREVKNIDGFHSISNLDLPPILTRPMKSDHRTIEATKFRGSSKLEEMETHQLLSVKTVKRERIRTQKEHKSNPLVRRSAANSAGIRLRANSPRLASRKIRAHARKSVSSRNRSLSGSFAIVKSSVDPQTDFRDSMVEMIVENNIRASKDLEDLLACYLSLNSNEYHGLIVKAFEQIWLEMAGLRL
ncbi:hypothetical protein I3760_13G063600 [Carya illinoinensis]|nr:hypothetical protein I3760_13G063600 [Carya illinoinensis]